MVGKETVTREYVLPKEVAETLEYEAESSGVPVEEALSQWMKDGFWVAFHDTEESVVKLKYIDPWTSGSKQVQPPEKDGETPITLKTFRRLRDQFPPVTAGVEYSKSFTSGAGFTTEVDDATDKNQLTAKRIINDFNKNVYQDQITVGLDSILDIMLDEAFTVGCAAAEIVYKNEFSFEDYADVLAPEADDDPAWGSKILESGDWKKFGGIVQLKFIDNAIERLKPYVNKETYKIEYWTVDEKKTRGRDGEKEEPAKLLPWQVLWLSWGRRGSNLKGTSLVRPVAETAILLEEILKAVGTSFRRWSDKKYFFILGDQRTGRSWAPPKIREFMHDTKSMIETGSSGIPVGAGFDIKEIGGEAYSGRDIIDALLSLITGGMRYPRTFLEQGKSFEGDKAWLAWIVTYATHQKLLRRGIEHQLWQRHLYCMVGTEQEVSKQGVRAENRSKVPVYVPKMQWRSEGKWHQETKLKMLTGILNVANPVGPELKLEVEDDMATTLNYNELDLENARKVLKTNQKIGVIESDNDLLKAEMLGEALEEMKKKGLHKDMIPEIGGLKKEEPEAPARPPPMPMKRLLGGVSRQTKETGESDRGGIAKPMGGTRKSNPRTGTVEETVQFDSYEEMFSTMVKMEEREQRRNVFTRMIEVLDKL